MKKILFAFGLVFLLLISINNVIAFDFDNVKTYDDKTKTATINNCDIWVGTCLKQGEKIADITLDTPHDFFVMHGTDRRVAQFTINNYGDSYSKALKRMEFYDLKAFKDISREFVYKYFDDKTGKWIKLNSFDIPKGEITIGIFTTVYPRERIEWIPTLFGKKVEEWAVWTSSLTEDLVLYYNFSDARECLELAGNLSYNLTQWDDAGSPATFEDDHPLIGSYGNFSLGRDSDGFNITATHLTSLGGANKSLNFWIRTCAYAGLNQNVRYVVAKGCSSNWVFVERDTGDDFLYSTDASNMTEHIKTLTADTWTMVTLTSNDSALSIYYDADLFGWGALEGGDAGPVSLGTRVAERGWECGAMDEMGWWNRSLSFSEITDLYNGGSGITYDGIPPSQDSDITVNLFEPADSSSSIAGSMSFNGTFVVTNGNFTNATLYVWNSSYNAFTNITTIAGETNSSNLTISNLEVNAYDWNYLVCAVNASGDYPPCEFADANYSWERKAISEDTNSFTIQTHETASEFFQENISAASEISVLSSTLNYNGTEYNAKVTAISATKYSLDATIDIPLLEKLGTHENKTWFFDFTYLEGTLKVSTNTTTRSHMINSTDFTQCAAPYKTGAVNYTIHHEENKSALSADFEAAFEYYLGSGTVRKTNYTILSSGEAFHYCIQPNKTFHVDASIDLEQTNFENRHYDLIDEIYTHENITNRQLFLLNATSGSQIIIEVKDQGLIPLKNYLVEIERFYPEENNYTMVESQLTDDFGQFVAKLIENDVKYKFKFYDPDKVLKKTSGDISIACRATICVIPFVIEEVSEDFDEFANLTSYSYSLTFDNSTNIFTFAWDDNRGENSAHRLYVQRILINGTTQVCNSSSTSLDGILTCDVGSSTASYRAQVFRSVSGGDERRIAVLNVKVGETYGTYGVEGLIWVFLLAFTCIAIGAFNPTVAAILYMAIFTFMGILGIISATIPIYIATYILGVIFIWSFKT